MVPPLPYNVASSDGEVPMVVAQMLHLINQGRFIRMTIQTQTYKTD